MYVDTEGKESQNSKDASERERVGEGEREWGEEEGEGR